MSKTININPDLFNFGSGGGTRKKRKTTTDSGIKIKIKPKEKEKNQTTKRALLKYIRTKQNENYDKLTKSNSAQKREAIVKPDIVEIDNFNSDFEESLKFLKTNADEQELKIKNENMHNRTLRNHFSDRQTDDQFNIPNSYDSIQIPTNGYDNGSPLVLNPPKIMLPDAQYGCLKGGKLQTYRNWKQNTQKNNIMHGSSSPMNHQPMNHQPMNHPPMNHNPMNNPMNQNITVHSTNPFHSESFNRTSSVYGGQSQIVDNKNDMREIQLKDRIKQMSEFKQLKDNMAPVKNKMRYPKQKRTVRRTYKVGKSKVHPKVSVLISNRTIRKNIATKAQLLKQTPIQDVKKYLMKHGFIKVGSTAPNDILRKMYESSILICGDIQNHNTDNLLYNFLNDST